MAKAKEIAEERLARGEITEARAIVNTTLWDEAEADEVV